MRSPGDDQFLREHAKIEARSRESILRRPCSYRRRAIATSNHVRNLEGGGSDEIDVENVELHDGRSRAWAPNTQEGDGGGVKAMLGLQAVTKERLGPKFNLKEEYLHLGDGRG